MLDLLLVSNRVGDKKRMAVRSYREPFTLESLLVSTRGNLRLKVLSRAVYALDSSSRE